MSKKITPANPCRYFQSLRILQNPSGSKGAGDAALSGTKRVEELSHAVRFGDFISEPVIMSLGGVPNSAKYTFAPLSGGDKNPTGNHGCGVWSDDQNYGCNAGR